MTPAPSPFRNAIALRLCVALIVVLCAALITAAALVPAPPAVVPLIVLVGIGCPMGAAYELPRAIAALADPVGRARGARALGHPDMQALAELRRYLDELPETQRPLGL